MFSEPSTLKRPRRYTQAVAQPFSQFFRFKPKHTHRSSVGHVEFSFTVAGREYGPYRTDLRTTTNVWESRKSLFATNGQKTLNQTIGQYGGMLEDGWAAYPNSGPPITGEMVLLASGLKAIETEEGFVYAH